MFREIEFSRHRKPFQVKKMVTLYMQISENSRIWIYQANRALTTNEQNLIQQKLDAFVGSWQAHGHQLAALAEIRYQRFIVLAIDEHQAQATGCSIDKSVGLMKELESEFGIQLFDRMQIAYRDGESIKTCSKDEFERLLEQGLVNEETIVFNNLIQNYRDLSTSWEVPMKLSWHQKVFAL